MSATPHNGKEADFQLFMGLLDADRFEGRFREGVHKADVSDMMRRLTKEELYRFDGTPYSRRLLNGMSASRGVNAWPDQRRPPGSVPYRRTAASTLLSKTPMTMASSICVS